MSLKKILDLVEDVLTNVGGDKDPSSKKRPNQNKQANLKKQFRTGDYNPIQKGNQYSDFPSNNEPMEHRHVQPSENETKKESLVLEQESMVSNAQYKKEKGITSIRIQDKQAIKKAIVWQAILEEAKAYKL